MNDRRRRDLDVSTLTSNLHKIVDFVETKDLTIYIYIETTEIIRRS